MHAAGFAKATRQEPRRILRVPMLEYSIGHDILLHRIDSPFLWETFPNLPDFKKREALIQAVSICSRTWEENKNPERWLKLWLWLVKHDDFDKAIRDFMEYRADGSGCPHILPPEKREDSRTLGAPYHCRVLAYAAPIFGHSVFDKGLSLLNWLYFAWAESEGQCRIENELERQIREEMAQHQADYEREQEEKKRANGCQH